MNFTESFVLHSIINEIKEWINNEEKEEIKLRMPFSYKFPFYIILKPSNLIGTVTLTIHARVNNELKYISSYISKIAVTDHLFLKQYLIERILKQLK